MNQYKRYFPIYKNNPELVYLDSAATTLKPEIVLEKMAEYYINYSANIHRGMYPISERATEEYEAVRKKVADFIGAEYGNEIIFTSGTTDSINLVATGWGEKNLNEGDEIVVTEMEHHSNLVPWQQLAKKLKAKLIFWPMAGYELSVASLDKIINKKTKLLAIAQVSNVLGTINPIKDIVTRAREISPDVVVVVDGAQAVAHMPVSVVDMEVDFYAFSGHKMYGPTGVGVLYAKASRMLQMEPVKYGGGMIKEVNKEDSVWTEGPEKFEAGTPMIAEVIGLGAAVEFLKNMGMDNITRHESELTSYCLAQLAKKKEIVLIGPKTNRVGVFSLRFDQEALGSAHDWSFLLGDKYNICTRAGHHCAMPLHNLLGLPNGTLRVSLGIYSTLDDIDKFIRGLLEIRTIFEDLDNNG